MMQSGCLTEPLCVVGQRGREGQLCAAVCFLSSEAFLSIVGQSGKETPNVMTMGGAPNLGTARADPGNMLRWRPVGTALKPGEKQNR